MEDAEKHGNALVGYIREKRVALEKIVVSDAFMNFATSARVIESVAAGFSLKARILEHIRAQPVLFRNLFAKGSCSSLRSKQKDQNNRRTQKNRRKRRDEKRQKDEEKQMDEEEVKCEDENEDERKDTLFHSLIDDASDEVHIKDGTSRQNHGNTGISKSREYGKHEREFPRPIPSTYTWCPRWIGRVNKSIFVFR